MSPYYTSEGRKRPVAAETSEYSSVSGEWVSRENKLFQEKYSKETLLRKQWAGHSSPIHLYPPHEVKEKNFTVAPTLNAPTDGNLRLTSNYRGIQLYQTCQRSKYDSKEWRRRPHRQNESWVKNPFGCEKNMLPVKTLFFLFFLNVLKLASEAWRMP